MPQSAQQLLLLLVLLLAFFLLVVRPQRARLREAQRVRAGLEVGQRVMTTAGLHATVRSVEDDTVLLEIAPGVEVRWAAAAVARVLDPAPAPGSSPLGPG